MDSEKESLIQIFGELRDNKDTHYATFEINEAR